jgi:hypothetical protein
MPMCPARIENMYSTLPRPEVQPDANRFSDRGCGNAKAAPGRRDSRRSGKFVGVVHIASTASDVSAVINYVDDRVAYNDDTIAQPNVDAAANMDPAANMDTAGANGGTAADYRPHHTAAACGSPVPADDGPAADEPADEPADDANVDNTARRAGPVSEKSEESRGLSKWVGVVGLFVAPTTVIASVCYYFGYVSTRKYFAYFGIDTDAVGFSSSDYVTRSVRALFVPVITGLLISAALIWAGAYLRRVVQSGNRNRARTLGWMAVAVGAVSMAWAIVSLTRPQWALIHVDALTPVALGLGAALLGLGTWMLTSSGAPDGAGLLAAARRASLVVVAGAIVPALFWITDIFAASYGEDQAKITTAGLWSQQSSVVLDADASQYLPVPPGQIKVTVPPPAADPAAKPKFLRYQCFRVLAVHGDRWILVPARWTPEYGYAVIVTADSSHSISVLHVKKIDASDAAKKRESDLECPEVAGAQAK